MIKRTKDTQKTHGGDYKTTALVLSWLMTVAAIVAALLCFVDRNDDAALQNDVTLEVTRIEAPYIPKPAIAADMAELIPESESDAAVEDTAAVTPALEIMSELPLRAAVQLEIEQMCADRDVDAAIVVAMIYHESRYDEGAVGDACNSYGLMQVRPDCHYDRMDRLGVTDLLDGVQNVTVGIDYLDELLDIYGGDYAAALTAYNRGHYSGFVNDYAKAVLEMAEEMR